MRSPDGATRLRAFQLIGLDEDSAKIFQYTNTGQPPTKVVKTPDQVSLQYAALGADATLQAIVAVRVMFSIYVAVAIEREGHWQRIATEYAGGKYDVSEPTAESVQLVDAPKSSQYELVLRSGSGGTGVYGQQENHYRVFHGRLVQVMSFESRYSLCAPPHAPYCELDKRWFKPATHEASPDRVLVHGHGRYDIHQVAPIFWSARDVEAMQLQTLTCQGFDWNQETFEYHRVKGNPCRAK